MKAISGWRVVVVCHLFWEYTRGAMAMLGTPLSGPFVIASVALVLNAH